MKTRETRGCVQSLGVSPRKNSGRYRFKKRAIDCAHSCCAGKVGVAHDRNGVAYCCAMQTTKIFTGDVRCKNNDRLGSIHTSGTKISDFAHSSEALSR